MSSSVLQITTTRPPLARNRTHNTMGKAVLLIVDGAGIREDRRGNAVTPVTMPRLFGLMETYGYATLEASGPPVGLGQGMVGNSEIGHLTIGAGFVVPSSLQRISNEFESGAWAAHDAWSELRFQARIHVVGLMSDAGVHGHWKSIAQSVRLAMQNCPSSEIVVHLVLDGIDSKAGTAPALLANFNETEGYKIGTIFGRQWFCDRSGDPTVTQVFVDGLQGRGNIPFFKPEALAAHLQWHSEASFPVHAVSRSFVAHGEPVILTSHRADRVRQSATALSINNPVYSLVDLDDAVPKSRVFFPARPLAEGLAIQFQKQGIANTRLAEKCKFPHVTHFFSGLNKDMGENAICIPSIPDKNLADTPEMSIRELVESALSILNQQGATHALVINVPNLDQIGHLGRYELACSAAALVDSAIGEIVDACRENQWSLLVTSDHGNADTMLDDHGLPFNSHSHSPVPFVVIPSHGRRIEWIRKEGTLANVAPTFLTMLEAEHPIGMVESLIQFLSISDGAVGHLKSRKEDRIHDCVPS